MLYIARVKIEPAETKLFVILISNFSTTLCRLTKHTVLASRVPRPPFIIGIDKDESNTATFSSEADSTVAVVHYKLKENQAEQMRQREAAIFAEKQHK